MFALGAYLLVSVAAAAPVGPVHAAEKLASTYEEASCDSSDSGECAEEIDLSLPAPTAILDCESPFIQEMIGSCDMPKPAPPTAHLPTLHTGSGIALAHSDGGGARLTVVSAANSVDAALPVRTPALEVPISSSPLPDSADRTTADLPRSRLDRPPRV